MWRRAVQPVVNLAQTRGLRNVTTIDPEYLDLLKPPVPVYEGLINVQLTGYDFPVLEQQTRRASKLLTKLGIQINETWATPLRSFKVQTYKPQSVTVDQTYNLQIYERNIQLKCVPGHMIGILYDVLQKNMAEGVKMSVHRHGPEHLEIRQIPDLELESLEKQLAESLNPSSNPHQKKQ